MKVFEAGAIIKLVVDGNCEEARKRKIVVVQCGREVSFAMSFTMLKGSHIKKNFDASL